MVHEVYISRSAGLWEIPRVDADVTVCAFLLVPRGGVGRVAVLLGNTCTVGSHTYARVWINRVNTFSTTVVKTGFGDLARGLIRPTIDGK